MLYCMFKFVSGGIFFLILSAKDSISICIRQYWTELFGYCHRSDIAAGRCIGGLACRCGHLVTRIRVYSRNELQISEEGESARERSDDMDGVFIDRWVGMRLFLRVFLFRRVQIEETIEKRSIRFASHLRHRAGGCDTVITTLVVVDGRDA